MSKRIKISLALLVVLGSSLVGCNEVVEKVEKPTAQEEQLQPETSTEMTIEYTNLIDTATQDSLKGQLLEIGISEEDVATFFEWVKDYNDRVEGIELFKEGFSSLSLPQVNYDPIILEPRRSEINSMSLETNCRLTSFLLFKDFFEVGAYNQIPDNYLMFDIEAINVDPLYEMNKESKEKFITLFNPVVVDAEADIDRHIEQIQEELQRREITYKEGQDISLINLYMHDNYENKRFVGHTAIAIETKEGILLVEKYSPELPFQCTKFNDEQEIVNYFLSRTDIYGDGTEGTPIVMRNNEVISH